MDRKKRFSRLGLKLAGVSVLGLALAFALYWVAGSVCVPQLLRSQRFEAFWQERGMEAVQAYQDYVTACQFTVQEAMDNEKSLPPVGVSTVFIAISDYEGLSDQGVSYVASWKVLAEEPSGWQESAELAVELQQIQCADGTLYVTAPSADLWIQSVSRLVGLLLALAGFCGVMIPCIVRLVRRVSVLSRETGILMAGDLEHPVALKGRDELSGLGEDIERLRRSVLERLEGEREAVEANRRLITGLSHDLRTPLTKLTGYLDILRYQKGQTPQQQEEYLRLAAEKAEQLRQLTEQMFAGAQARTPQSALQSPAETVDGPALLGQILAELCDDLAREDFDARPPVFGSPFTLHLRPEDAVRVFDNLFSNFRKYADPAAPIHITAEESPQSVTLRLTNRIRSAPEKADSHGLGVPTMGELMARSGGALETALEGESYTSTLVFPKAR